MTLQYLPGEMKMGPYSCSHLPEKYQIPHPHPLCVPGSLSFQNLPTPTYSELQVLKRHPELLANNKVSGAQIEAALHAMSRFTSDKLYGEQPGFYLGDMTGTGKSRTCSLLIHENLINGHDKAVWISVTKELKDDTVMELQEVNCPLPVFLFAGTKSSPETEQAMSNGLPGIMFTTYSMLRSGTGHCNLFKLADWLKAKFSGMIVLDECHSVRNETNATDAVNWIQEMFPFAKMMYVTATAGTEPTHLSYMGRLGLWGNGCPFKDVEEFKAKMSVRGLGAMELIANYLQSNGSFVARQLDIQGVHHKSHICPLTDDEKVTYNMAASLWQSIYNYMRQGQIVTGKWLMHPKDYWGRHLRFFEALIMTFKMRIIRKLRRKYPADRYSLVFALQHTGQECFKKDPPHLHTIQQYSLCRSMLLQILKTKLYIFPERIVEIKPTMEEVLANEYLLLANRLGRNPLDSIIWKLGGPTEVFEITGRTVRQFGCESDESDDEDLEVSKAKKKTAIGDDSNSEADSSSETEAEDAPAVEMTQYTRVPFSINHKPLNIANEKDSFNNGEKRAIIISQKGSTGISLHSGRTFLNQTQRVQVTIQIPWLPENAVQQLGRTHRSDQVVPPISIILTTDIPGELRFATSFSERLKKMGAICHGERDASSNISQGLVHPFSESPAIGNKAAKKTVNDILANKNLPAIQIEFENVGLFKSNSDKNVFKGDLNNLLNRTLGMKLDAQNLVMETLIQNYNDIYRDDKLRGEFDPGMKGVNEKWVLKILEMQTFGQGRESCTLLRILADRGVSWMKLQVSISKMKQADPNWYPIFLSKDQEIACCYVGDESEDFFDKTMKIRSYYVYTPWSCELTEHFLCDFEDWDTLDYENKRNEIQTSWESLYNKGKFNFCIHQLRKVPCEQPFCTEGCRKFEVTVLRGCLLQVWDAVKDVYRPAKSNATKNQMLTIRIAAKYQGTLERFVGLFVPKELVLAVISKLNAHYSATLRTTLIENRKSSFAVQSIWKAWKNHDTTEEKVGYEDSICSSNDEGSDSENEDPHDSKDENEEPSSDSSSD